MRNRLVLLILLLTLSLLGTGCEDSLIFPSTTTTTILNPDTAVGWAVGDTDGSYGVILHTTNGGQTWTRQGSTAEVPNVSLDWVFALNATTAWIVGPSVEGYGLILKTTNSGTNWVRQGSTTDVPALEIAKVHALDTNTAWVVGYNSTILKTTDGGASWLDQTPPTSVLPNNVQLQGVFALNENTVWVSGDKSGGFGTILKTTNGGATWVRQGTTAPTVPDLFVIDVKAVDANVVWACGQNSLILGSTDGGSTWQDKLPGHALGDSNSIWPFDVNTAWVVKDYDKIVHTTDSGTTWITQEVSVYGHFLLGLSALNRQVAWIAGRESSWPVSNVILRTTDGGSTTWEAQTTPLSTGLVGISIVPGD